MTSVSELRSAIEDLEEVLDGTGASDRFAGSVLSRRSLEMHHDRLEGELAMASRSELEVHLSGLPVVGHEIRVDALARFLARLQDSVSSIAQALTGRVTERAPLPGSLRESAGLRLTGVFPGSFGATLLGPERPADGGLFEVSAGPTLLDVALKRTLELMDASSDDDGASEDSIVELVAPLGARTFGHLRRLSQHMSDEDISAEFLWTSANSRVPQLSRLTTRGARRLNDVLTYNTATEDAVVLVGLLGTASEIRNMIELQLSNGEIVSARVIEDVVADLRRYFGTPVQAALDVTTVVSATTGVERRTYVLTGLAPANE